VGLRREKGWNSRMRIDPKTTKATIGSRQAARSSCWLCGGSCGVGSCVSARVDMNTAPTPMGPGQQKSHQLNVPMRSEADKPKCPEKKASLQFLISGIHL
jgi:hypothetical protein